MKPNKIFYFILLIFCCLSLATASVAWAKKKDKEAQASEKSANTDAETKQEKPKKTKKKNTEEALPPAPEPLAAPPIAVAPPPEPVKKNLGFLFLYPDGEGTPEEAQPILDALFEFLKEKTGLIIEGHYVTDQAKALEESKTADMAVVSLGFYAANKKIVLMEVALETQLKGTPNPAAYTLVGNKEDKTETIKTVYTSAFIPPSLLKIMLPDTNTKRETTHESIALLKKLATAPGSGAFLMDPFEYNAYSKLNLSWKENLKNITVTKAFPQAPFVFLKPLVGKREKIVQALQALSLDPKGVDILSSLRLQGFVTTNAEQYKKILVTDTTEPQPTPQ
ncbi:phosphate/phosphite/phosphonate ABC transporter substrate-binding protein [bacterium]|nr:phosphate/phosphite/phosphonate ABC transporter substrate-binding protein [bacterium]